MLAFGISEIGKVGSSYAANVKTLDAYYDRLDAQALTLMRGVELNADVGYESEVFHAGLAYGVLFPLSALNHPSTLREQNVPLGPLEFENNAGDAGAAQTLQLRLLLRF